MSKEIIHEEIPKTIALRPRFQRLFDQPKERIIEAFRKAKSGDSGFIITLVDDHIFIKIPRITQHYWSPQLHLEITEDTEKSSKIYGLFGPNPTVWTMFMFLHFIVATLFFAAGIWAYSNWSLEKDYAVQVFFTLFTVFIWFTLYFLGRIGRSKGKPQMHDLNAFMEKTMAEI